MNRAVILTALEELARIEPRLDPEVLTPGLLDSLAWRLNRSEREAYGQALIEANPEHARARRLLVNLKSKAED